jgi:hypothetical protein
MLPAVLLEQEHIKGSARMRFILIASVALLATTAVASAEAFTFTGKGTLTSQVGAPGPGGRPIGTSMAAVENETTWASGKKTTNKGTCGTWSAPPGSGMTNTGACTLSGPDGIFSVAYGCASLNDKNTVANCWGSLTGTSGSLQGKTGTASWRVTQSADGKSTTSVGSGQWY